MNEGPVIEPPAVSPAPERRRPGWAEFRRGYRGLVAVAAVVVLVLLAADIWIVMRRLRYHREIARLRASMTDLERQRTDQLIAQEQNKLRLALELLRKQAQLERALHLTVTVDSGTMQLEREGALLRTMPVQIGPERTVGVAPDSVRLAAPRGLRTIVAILGENDTWQVPAWVYAERGLADSSRAVRGALGPAAILLDGGTVIYSMPTAGPLNDSSYVLPGSVRARAEDLRAVLPNLSAGVRVYFY